MSIDSQHSDRLAHLSVAKRALLEKRLRGDGSTAAAESTTVIQPIPAGADPVVSFAQERIWFLQQLAPDSAAYNIHEAVRWQGHLQPAALQQAVNLLMARHDALRTIFQTQNGRPVPHVLGTVKLPLPLVDLQGLPASEQAEQVQELAVAEAQRPFRLQEGPLLRTSLLQLASDHFVLLLTIHHIISDEWSLEKFWGELRLAYQAIMSGQSPALPNLPIDYSDYAYWQRTQAAEKQHQDELAYWQGQLEGELPFLQLPTDRRRPPALSDKGGMRTRQLPEALLPALRRLAQANEASPYMTLLAAFQVLLYRYSRQNDILVGTPIANRGFPEIQDVLGLFLNTLVIRARIEEAQTFTQFLSLTRQTVLAAFAHQELPFEQVVQAVQPRRDLSLNPLFQVMFVYQQEQPVLSGWQEARLTKVPVDGGVAKFDLTLFVTEKADQLTIAFEYRCDLFDEPTIDRMLSHFAVLLQSAITVPETAVSRLPWLPDEERQLVLEYWNQTGDEALASAPTRIQATIEKFARETPAAAAVAFAGEQITYAELNQRANRLAHYLQTRGVKPGANVAICLERSLEMIVGILAVLKAGAAYVPLDPGYPAGRLAWMLDDCQAALILTQTKLLNRLPQPAATAVAIDGQWPEISQQPAANLPAAADDRSLAYVIYTSGSTGRPKGVMVTQRNLIHSTLARLSVYPRPVGRFLLLSSISFDSSIVGIFGTLCRGGTLVLPVQGQEHDVQQLAQLIDQHQVTHLLALPSLYALLLEGTRPPQLASLTDVIVAGEACAPALVETHYGRLPRAALYNEYGPTEGSVWSTVYLLPSDWQGDSVPIGKPIPNVSLYLLDSQQQPVPVGVAGEIHIAGRGLARGYLNRPGLTAEKFIPNPYGGQRGERLYKTGDLGRYLPDGRLEYLGRLDHQVKIRGYRLEPGEIEAALRQHTAVRDALVIVRDNGEEAELVAYVVGEAAAMKDLRSFLKGLLPAYMMPGAIVPLEQFPTTPNGKIDRNALPKPGEAGAKMGKDTFVAPQNALESQLVTIWQEILHQPAVSTDANFFEIGGHSLRAVKLFSAIEKRLKVQLPISLLFEYPTIRQLAAAMGQGGEAASWSSLVPIQPLGDKRPLFCVHGGAGHVFHYYDLALLLGQERPFYGLRPKMDQGSGESVFSRVEEMAAHYIEEIKMVQPEGPYLLSGFCFGGIVAYEMAQQLTRAGEKITMLTFIDPSTPQNALAEGQTDWPEGLANRVARHQQNMVHLGQFTRLNYLLNRSKHWLMAQRNKYQSTWLQRWRWGQAKMLQKYIKRRQLVPARFRDFYFMHLVASPATQAYRPRGYPGEIVLFYSTLENHGDETLGWDSLPQKGLRLYGVESTHLGILKRPGINEVAEKLRSLLDAES